MYVYWFTWANIWCANITYQQLSYKDSFNDISKGENGAYCLQTSTIVFGYCQIHKCTKFPSLGHLSDKAPGVNVNLTKSLYHYHGIMLWHWIIWVCHSLFAIVRYQTFIGCSSLVWSDMFGEVPSTPCS